MTDHANVTRRAFLYGTAALAASATLAACSSGSNEGSKKEPQNTTGAGSTAAPAKRSAGSAKGSASKPVTAPASLRESPALTTQVKAGTLPSIDQRLPDHPYVLPHKWLTPGRYGGSLRMVQYGVQGMANADGWPREFFYGHSPIRWLNDGLDIGPGIAESWSSNAESSQWTLKFRTGLRWSDGHPWTVDDIIFWYEDIALPGHDAQVPPPETLSASGKTCRMTKLDDTTLRLTYDAPQPLLPSYLACFVNGGLSSPAWMFPKHYLRQFHPKYNKSVPNDWDSVGGLWEQKADWLRNPDCPTLTAFKCKSFDNNSGLVLERNPYYYGVSPSGDQLPYLDKITIDLVQDPQVIKLKVQQGHVDYCHGPANDIALSDVSTLSNASKQGNYQVITWQSGSGTGSMFFFNRDYPDAKYRKIIRDKRLIRAISLAYDRKSANHTLYFDSGELTTGTMSPKAIEFHSKPDGSTVYKHWRDCFKDRDVAKAKRLLHDMGLRDTNGDGYVEFPDGSKLTIDIPYSADASSTEQAKDDQLVTNAKDIGLRMVRRPIPPQAYQDSWNNGKFMSHTNWEASDGPNCLVFPQWLAPLDDTRWAPLEGTWYMQTGTGKNETELNLSPWHRHPPRMPPEKGGPTARLVKLYEQTKRETREMERTRLVWQMMKIHITEGPFFIGTAANYPVVIVANNALRNVPREKNLAQGGFTNPWTLPCPAVYDPAAYYWDDPSSHD